MIFSQTTLTRSKRCAKLILAVAVTLTGAVIFHIPAGLAAETPRIGFLGATNRAAADYLIQGFLDGLRNHGYEEGKNIEILWRHANGDAERFGDLAEDLVEQDVDIIVSPSLLSTLAAQFETDGIPIVFALVADPVGSGLVESMSKPGGNITGVSITSAELSAKRLELLKDAFPRLAKVCVLFESPEVIEPVLADLNASAPNLGLTIQPRGITNIAALEATIADAKKQGAGAVLVPLSPLFLQNRRVIIDAITKHQLPAIYEIAAFVNEGGLISYGPNYPDSFKRAADITVKILEGSDPADIPVEQPLRFELIVNQEAAGAIGVTLPPSVLFRADRVIR